MRGCPNSLGGGFDPRSGGRSKLRKSVWGLSQFARLRLLRQVWDEEYARGVTMWRSLRQPGETAHLINLCARCAAMREVIRSCPQYTLIISPFANQPSRRPTQYFDAHARGRGQTRLSRDFPLPPSRVDKSGTNPERICQAGGQVVGRSVGRDNSLMPKVAPP